MFNDLLMATVAATACCILGPSGSWISGARPPNSIVFCRFRGGYAQSWMGTGWWLTCPSEKWSSSVGMMKFPVYGKIKNVPNHQPGEKSQT